MLKYTTAESREDLLGILALQKANLPQALTREQIESQGFVTVNHTYDVLKKLNDIEAHVIARNQDKVVAYLLAMTVQSQADIPILIPMFEAFGNTLFGSKKISAYNYIVVGQACVDRQYRGQGVFDDCYAAYRKAFQHKYDFAITEIASTNTRSLAAHKRVGFQEISRYTASDGVEWVIVVWDWPKPHQG